MPRACRRNCPVRPTPTAMPLRAAREFRSTAFGQRLRPVRSASRRKRKKERHTLPFSQSRNRGYRRSDRRPRHRQALRKISRLRYAGIPATAGTRIRPSLELLPAGASLRQRSVSPPHGGDGSQTIHKTNKINSCKRDSSKLLSFHIAKVSHRPHTGNRQMQ